jgi:hypothetical protein
VDFFFAFTVFVDARIHTIPSITFNTMPKYAKFDEDAGSSSPKKVATGGSLNVSSSKYATFDNALCEDDDDDDVTGLKLNQPDSFGNVNCSLFDPIQSVKSFGNTLMFFWMQPLLRLGNSQPLNLSDLYDLEKRDQASSIYDKFYEAWQLQLQRPEPSLAWAFVKSFGTPFFLAGGLKLIHDCLIFVGPILLNKIILFLDDPDKPVSLGMFYVLALFVSQVIMVRLCLFSLSVYLRCYKCECTLCLILRFYLSSHFSCTRTV